MSMVAVQDYVKSVLDGMPSALLDPAIAVVQPPPVMQLAGAPVIYIWGGTLDEDRKTLPRFRAEKRIGYLLRIWLQWVGSNDPDIQRGFPVFLDAVRATLRSTIIPAELYDPYTNEHTQLLNLGERIKLEYGTPLATATQGMLLHTAAMQCPAAEHLNPG